MKTKICKVCGKEKEVTEDNFRFNKGYFSNICKECSIKKHREYNKRNRDLINIKNREYYSKSEVKQKRHDYKQKYMKEHKEEIKQKNKEYNSRPEIKEKRKKYLLENKEHIKQITREYQNKNRERLNKHERDRRKNDDLYRLKNIVRKLVDRSFNYINKEKCNKTKEIVGLSIDELENYLLQTFKDNYGYEWDGVEKVHIDHIIPLATAKTEQDVIKLCHYTNLQLLKAKDNLKKGTKLDWKLSNNESVVMPNA